MAEAGRVGERSRIKTKVVILKFTLALRVQILSSVLRLCQDAVSIIKSLKL